MTLRYDFTESQRENRQKRKEIGLAYEIMEHAYILMRESYLLYVGPQDTIEGDYLEISYPEGALISAEGK